MFRALNPYVLSGAAVIALLIGGAFWRVDGLRAHYKKLSETRYEKIVSLETQIKIMTTIQDTQTSRTEQNVIRVTVPPPETKTIVNNIREAPLPEDCKTPVLSEETKNAF